MSKVIVSPVAEFPGTVTLYDPLTLPMVQVFNRGLDASKEQDEAVDKIISYLPGLLGCIQKWDIPGIPPEMQNVDNFPGSPLAAVCNLVAWLIREINKVMIPSIAVPNA
jgi:hypothetical protein